MKRGRSKKLLELRDEALLYRYYYLTEVKRIRFDDALKILSEGEFFISENRILSIIHAKHHRLDQMRASSKPPVRRRPKVAGG